jgi:hypothetical protein
MIRHLFSERGFRSYANHLALTVRKQDGVPLRKRYGDKKTIGVYHSLAMLERGIQRFGDRYLASKPADVIALRA